MLCQPEDDLLREMHADLLNVLMTLTTASAGV